MKKQNDFSVTKAAARTAVLCALVGCSNIGGTMKTTNPESVASSSSATRDVPTTPNASTGPDVSTPPDGSPGPHGDGHRHGERETQEGGHPSSGHHHAGAPGADGAHGSAHQHGFDDAARWAKVFDDPARDAWQKPARVIEVMAITPGMSVADVGAGTGYFAVRLSKAVGSSGKVIAEDIEPDMVKWLGARAKREGLANIEARLGAKDDPRLAASSVDRVLVADVWHHIDDRAAFAKKVATALKPGGVAFIVDFTLDSPHGPPKAARVSPEAVASDLASAGLSTAVVKDAGLPYHFIVRGKR